MDRIRNWYRSFVAAASEAAICFALGLKEGLHPGVFLRSASLCAVVSVVCAWLFVHYFKDIALACGFVALYTAFSVANFALLPSASMSTAGIPGMAAVPSGALNALAGLAQLAFYFVSYATLFFAMLFAASIVLGIRLSMRFVLLGYLQQRVQRKYLPVQGAPVSQTSLLKAARYRLAPWLGVSGWTLVGLLVPLYNGVILLSSLAYLNIRFLLPVVLHPLAGTGEQLEVIRARKGCVLIFGLLIVLLALVPVLNLLLPAVLGAGACHLGNRALMQLRGERGALDGDGDSLACGEHQGPDT